MFIDKTNTQRSIHASRNYPLSVTVSLSSILPSPFLYSFAVFNIWLVDVHQVSTFLNFEGASVIWIIKMRDILQAFTPVYIYFSAFKLKINGRFQDFSACLGVCMHCIISCKTLHHITEPKRSEYLKSAVNFSLWQIQIIDL